MTDYITATKAGSKEWIGLAILTLPALLAATDLSMLFMAAPWLSAELEPTGSQLLWIMDIYGFVLAGVLLTMGTLGDRIGRRRLLTIGSVIFGAASLMAAYSTSAEMLILARALLGIGAATLAPTTLALVRHLFLDEGQRRIAVGIWASSFSVGVPLGAIAGGLLVERFWWGSVFLVNIPVAALLIALTPLLPESTSSRPARFDLLSVALSMGAIFPIIWSMKQLVEYGWNPLFVVTTGVGVLLGYVFIQRQRSHQDPMIDVRLFRLPAFSASIAANSSLTLASAVLGMLAFQHLQLVLGYRPFITALWLLPVVATVMAGIAFATALGRWVRPAFVVGTGLAVAAVGFGLFIQLDASDTISTVLINYSILNLGMGMTISLAYNLVVATAPPEQSGAATAVNETGTELSGAVGIATLGTIAAAIYTRRLDDTMPADVPPEAADAASGSLGGAMAIADRLPADLAVPLVQSAQEAFTLGINLTAVAGSGLLAITAIAVTIALRNVRLDSDQRH